ncbi:hypothetical protein CXB35_18880 [Pseudomonas syringae]|nr:hypothetical protein CXB35_18880 [Pseudomonas syringae]
MFAQAVFQKMHFRRSYRPFREQVRSYGLRPESKADLGVTLSAPRGRGHAVLDALERAQSNRREALKADSAPGWRAELRAWR